MPEVRREAAATFLACAVFAVIYGFAARHLSSMPRETVAAELLATLPRFAQVTMAAGDRHLAANLAGFRVLVASTDRMSKEDYAVQARLQKDIAWLNPAHEDNSYIAASILPWSGEVDAALYVLKRAADARPFDWSPLFYYGFGFYHFKHDPAEGARWLLAAAERATVPQDQWALQNIAAQWIEKGYETRTAANLVESMAAGAPAGSFRKYLHLRAVRLGDLARLRELADTYARFKGKNLSRLDDLVSAGLLESLPRDPLGLGYDLDPEGRPILRTSPAARVQ
ncbi:MAG: hypothetical protein NTV11_18740 [Rhodocyclales bacterium]|nr:hypothetical protein [Rhodocyclales bacterium]